MPASGKRTPRLVWAHVALLATFLLLTGVFIYRAESLTRAGISRNVYFLVLVLAGLGAAAFLDRALRASDAEWVGKFWFGKFRLGGSAAIVGMVVAAGAYVSSGPTPLQLVVRAHPEREDPGALAQGKVTLVAGKLSWTKDLSSAGEAVFERLPEQVRTESLRVVASVPGYRRQEADLQGIPPGEVIELSLTVAAARSVMSGTVLTADAQPLEGALVDIEHGLVQSRTDSLGHFHAEVPRAAGVTVLVMVFHGGRVGHQGYYTVPNELTLQFRTR